VGVGLALVPGRRFPSISRTKCKQHKTLKAKRCKLITPLMMLHNHVVDLHNLCAHKIGWDGTVTALAIPPSLDGLFSAADTSSPLGPHLAAPTEKTAATKTAPACEKHTRALCAICHKHPFTSKRLCVHFCQRPGKPTNLLCCDCIGTKAHGGRYRWHDTISFHGVA
jgi:hypothetical protein